MNGEQPNQEQSQKPTPSTTPSADNFFSRHSRAVTRVIIIAIIIIGAVIYSQSQNPEASNVPENSESEASLDVQENDVTLVSDENSKDDTSITVEDSSSASPEVTVTRETPEVTIKVSGEKITVVAQKGNGYTHLARRALAEYLDTTGDQGLQVEHKIFAEDYLQKKITDRQGLNPGDEISFSQDQIQTAIDSALLLNDTQVDNLTQYVPLVPSLN